MSIRTVSSREFNQDVSKAKRAASKGPVFITDRGRAEYVLLTIDEYEKLIDSQVSIVELLAMPEVDDIDFKPLEITSKSGFRIALRLSGKTGVIPARATLVRKD